MKNIIFLCFWVLMLLPARAQVKSSHDGFYDADSVFYELTGTGSFKYCVNCYNADSLKPYTRGVWLHSREHASNTWENKPYSSPDRKEDSIHTRATVVKANTIWVRVYHDTGYTDQHHFVFLGTWRPKVQPVVSVFLDSSDFLGPGGFYAPGAGMKQMAGFRWNFRLKIQKKCSYQIYGGKDLQLQAAQAAGVEIGGQEAAEFANKSIQLNAKGADGGNKELMLGEQLTDSLGPGIKVLRFRVGGHINHRTTILVNEIVSSIITPDIGGEPTTPVCVFVNGSFWSYAMAEEFMNPVHIAKVLNVPRSALISAKVVPLASLQAIRKRVEVKQVAKSVYNVCGFLNTCPNLFVNRDTIQLEVDTSEPRFNPEVFDELCNSVRTSNDTVFRTHVDVLGFCRYTLAIWFFQVPDPWGYHLTLAKVENKPWEIFSDHYDFKSQDALDNDWDKYVVHFPVEAHAAQHKTLPWQVMHRIWKSDPDDFCRIVEDELNITYSPQKTVPIAEKKMAELRPCINECSAAWWPNGWADSSHWEALIDPLIPFLKERPDGIALALPKIFMSGADTLLTLKDMHTVRVVFDSVQGKGVSVKLNSLVLTKNFTGRYYPRPVLNIALQYDAAKYEFVRWLEYPGKPVAFQLSATQTVTLTPVLRLK